MSKLDYTLHITWWIFWIVGSLAMTIVISDGLFIAFAGLPPLFGVVSVWLAQHIWIFVTIWVALSINKMVKLFMF
jgi:hypothetical protein